MQPGCFSAYVLAHPVCWYGSSVNAMGAVHQPLMDSIDTRNKTTYHYPVNLMLRSPEPPPHTETPPKPGAGTAPLTWRYPIRMAVFTVALFFLPPPPLVIATLLSNL